MLSVYIFVLTSEKSVVLSVNQCHHVSVYVKLLLFTILGCRNLSVTSATSKQHGCTYSTNAGYFHEPFGGCIGNLIVNSTVQQVSTKI